jgi:hypothetical protein
MISKRQDSKRSPKESKQTSDPKVRVQAVRLSRVILPSTPYLAGAIA